MASWDKFLHQKMTLSVTLVDCRLLQKLLAFLSAFFASFFLLFFGFFSYCLVLIGGLFLTPFFHLFIFFLLPNFYHLLAYFLYQEWSS
jgi:glucose-6-phosphate-specific signal transduction histidine kinase